MMDLLNCHLLSFAVELDSLMIYIPTYYLEFIVIDEATKQKCMPS